MKKDFAVRRISKGKIIEPPEANIRKHEYRTAKALATSGLVVEFVLPSDRKFSKSADVLIEGHLWEMKSPRTDKLNQIQNNLKKANRQSAYIIMDSQRIRKLPDSKIQEFLVSRFKSQKSIKRLLFVNRRRAVIDIGMLN